MAQNLTETRSLLGHCPRAGLAQPNAVSNSSSFQKDLIVLLVHGEVIAWDRAPAEMAIGGSLADSSELFSAAPSFAGSRLNQRAGCARQNLQSTE
jgi:hypothetical protein